MATTYVCAQLVVNTCRTWVVQSSTSLIPELTADDRNALILFTLKAFVIVFGARQVFKIFGHRQ